MTESAQHVYQAINAVQADLSKVGIAKDKKNQGQGFRFRGIDDVLNTVSALLAKHNLVIIPRCTERLVAERKTAKGSPLFGVTVQMEYKLVSAVDSSFVTACTYGEAMDSADKATNKAMSAAYKYMAIQTFAIPTEGDNDADAHSPEVAPAPEPRDMTGAIRACTTLEMLQATWKGMTPAEQKLHATIKDAKKAELSGE